MNTPKHSSLTYGKPHRRSLISGRADTVSKQIWKENTAARQTSSSTDLASDQTAAYTCTDFEVPTTDDEISTDVRPRKMVKRKRLASLKSSRTSNRNALIHEGSERSVKVPKPNEFTKSVPPVQLASPNSKSAAQVQVQRRDIPTSQGLDEPYEKDQYDINSLLKAPVSNLSPDLKNTYNTWTNAQSFAKVEEINRTHALAPSRSEEACFPQKPAISEEHSPANQRPKRLQTLPEVPLLYSIERDREHMSQAQAYGREQADYDPTSGPPSDSLQSHPEGFPPEMRPAHKSELNLRPEGKLVMNHSNSKVSPDLKKLEKAPVRSKLKDRLSLNTPRQSSDVNYEDQEGISQNLPGSPFQNFPVADRPSTGMDGDRTAAPATSLNRHKVTYSRQRSHMAGSDGTADEAWEGHVLAGLDPTTVGYQQPFSQKPSYEQGLFKASHTEDDEEGLEKPLRSIHELRAAGGLQRTGFELEAVIDDLYTRNELGVRRNALFELALKLMQPSFRDDFVRQDYAKKFYALSQPFSDVPSAAAYLIALCLIFPSVSSMDFIEGGPASKVLKKASRFFEETEPLNMFARSRNTKMSKAQRIDFGELCKKGILIIGLGTETPSQLTLRLLALRSLELFARRTRESGRMHPVLDSIEFESLTKICKDSFRHSSDALTTRLESSTTLSILEADSTGDLISIADHTPATSQQSTENILCVLTTVMSTSSAARLDTTSLLLRLCLNVTTKSSKICARFAQDTVVQCLAAFIDENFSNLEASIPTEVQDITIDNLILGLGFLTNLMEEVPESRIMSLTEFRAGQTCLHAFLRIFQTRNEVASVIVTEFESKINVAYGYVAVLVCWLSLDARVRNLVGRVLEDKSLIKVRQAVAQFMIFHRTIDIDLETEHADGFRPQAVFVQRLQQLLSQLNEACMGGRDNYLREDLPNIRNA